MPVLLSEFLEELRGEGSGFEAGDGQYLAALTLLETMASRGEVPASPEGWSTLLAPVLCSSPEQQKQFHELYRGWLARVPKAVTTAPPLVPEEKAAPRKTRDRSARLGVLLRRFSRGLWVLAAGCVCALAFLVYRHLHPPPPPPPPLETTTDSSSLQTPPNEGTGCATANCTPPAQTSLRVRSPSGVPVAGATVYFAGLTGHTDPPGDFALDRSHAPNARYALVAGSGYLPAVVALRDADQEVRLLPLPEAPVPRWRSFPSQHPGAIGSLLLSLAAALGGLWLLRVWRGRLELRKWAVPPSEERRSLGVSVSGRGVYRPAGIRALATALRRRRPEESADLDAAATVESTARHAGYFTPVFARRTSEPDYLFVGERKNLRDHQARLHDELVTRLRDHDVQMQRYYFQSDPRICVDSKGVCTSLPELATVFRDHEVWLAMDAARCLDARTHRPHRWWSVLERWHDRLLLTPTPPDFNLEVLATRPTRAGLAAFLDSGPEARVASVPFPSVLRGAAGEWLDRSEPPPALLARLIAQLQMYLGPAGYLLLQACAVYPELAYNITVTLAGELLSEADVEPALERLVELPWFRHGIMPDWLRVRLVSRLGTREAAVRAALLHYLDGAYSTSQGKAEVLDILPGAPKLKPRPGPLEDHVYLSFVRGRLSELSVEAPSRWKRLLRHPQLPGPWAIAGGICLLSFVAGWVIGGITDKHPLTLKPGSYAYLLYEVATAQEGSQAPIDEAAAIQADSAVVADLMNVADPLHRDGDRLEIAGALSFKAGPEFFAPGMLAENVALGEGTNTFTGRLELIKSVDGKQVTFFRRMPPVALDRVSEVLDLSSVTPDPASVRSASTPEPPKTTTGPGVLPVVVQPDIPLPTGCAVPAVGTQLCTVGFREDPAHPARVNGEAKACLDDLALNMQRSTDAKLYVVGSATADETSPGRLAASRALNVETYLVSEKGVPASRIKALVGPLGMKAVSSSLQASDAPTLACTRPASASRPVPAVSTPSEVLIVLSESGGESLTKLVNDLSGQGHKVSIETRPTDHPGENSTVYSAPNSSVVSRQDAQIIPQLLKKYCLVWQEVSIGQGTDGSPKVVIYYPKASTAGCEPLRAPRPAEVSQTPPAVAMYNSGTRTPPGNAGGAPPTVVNVPAMATTANLSPRPTGVPLPTANSANRVPVAANGPATANVSQTSPASAAKDAFARALVESRRVTSFDGKLVAERESTLITISSSAGRAVRQIESPQPVGAIAWSPDSRLLAAADVYGTVSLWDVGTGQLHSKFAGTSLIRTLAWSPNGAVLAVGDTLEGIGLYDAGSGKLTRTLKTTGQQQPIVQSMAWDTRGVLLTCTYTDGIRVWNVLTGELVSQKPVVTTR